MVSKEEIENMALEVEKENSIFASKSRIDALAAEGTLVGREQKAKELVRCLVSHQGYMPPFVFVFGRTGSGKSALVRFVCENLPVKHRTVDLRKARTVFECAGLILSELGGSPRKGYGITAIVEGIASAIEAAAEKGSPFVLVLDEFDILMSDKKGRPSDFVYRLLVVQSELKEKGIPMTIIAISNNSMVMDDLDDRVRSRIGGSPEIFFDAYSKETILEILKERAGRSFAGPVDQEVLECCAHKSAQEHGDARRAIDLLRAAAEAAGSQGEAVGKKHIEIAAEQLQKDKVTSAMARMSYHQMAVCASVVRLTYLTEDDWSKWFSTSVLYDQYCTKIVDKNTTSPLTYRRVSELLAELENVGLIASRKLAEGKGYGRQYRLTVPPEMVGTSCFPEYWNGIVDDKTQHDEQVGRRAALDRVFANSRKGYKVVGDDKNKSMDWWKEFVGI